MRNSRDGDLGIGLAGCPTGTASHGFGVEIPPFHTEVFGAFGADLAFCQFWQKWPKTSAWDGVFGIFAIFGKNDQNSLRV